MMPDLSTRTQPRSRLSPLLDLLRTTLHERGSVTLRAMPAGEDLVRIDPCNDALLLADDPDDARLLTSIVYGLHFLGVADCDPRLDRAVSRHVEDATGRTMAGMGERAC